MTARAAIRTWVREHFVTPDAVYGLILYTAILGGVSDDDASSLEVLLVSAFTLVVFWGAHVFAGTIAGHGVRNGHEVTLGAATRLAIRHSSGMLYAAIVPTLIMLLGVFHAVEVDDAVSIALLAAMVILGVLGYQAFSQRGAKVIVRILGGVGTAFFGLLIVLLNLIVH
jgi:hypothetical protein